MPILIRRKVSTQGCRRGNIHGFDLRAGAAGAWRVNLRSREMLKHIVMWKLKEHAEGADKATNARKLKGLLDACADIVPGIEKFEVALAEPDLEATYDVVLYSEFTSRAALNAYQEHPEHVALKPFIGAIRDARQCMDYEV
jgi:heme-degrading monooxygenase HmoA